MVWGMCGWVCVWSELVGGIQRGTDRALLHFTITRAQLYFGSHNPFHGMHIRRFLSGYRFLREGKKKQHHFGPWRHRKRASKGTRCRHRVRLREKDGRDNGRKTTGAIAYHTYDSNTSHRTHTYIHTSTHKRATHTESGKKRDEAKKAWADPRGLYL